MLYIYRITVAPLDAKTVGILSTGALAQIVLDGLDSISHIRIVAQSASQAELEFATGKKGFNDVLDDQLRRVGLSWTGLELNRFVSLTTQT